MSDSEDFELDSGMFEEPQDFRPPQAESHYVEYERKVTDPVPSKIKLKLVGKSPLWGHLLWNAGIYTADYLDKHAKDLVTGKRVLELGAASALPSLVCALNDASLVVSTDYPDPELISNIEDNFEAIKPHVANSVEVKGFIWGNDVASLFGAQEDTEITEKDKFDLVILSDLVFNHTEHEKLLKTCQETCKKNGKCFVVFSPHRAHLVDADLKFFETCEHYGFRADPIDLIQMTPMFEEDETTASIRARVYSYYLTPI